MSRKGFTLIELLVVIAIVAILSVVVILTLNPAELLKQSRDSNRIADSATIKSSLALYLADGNAALSTSSYNQCWQTAAGNCSALYGTTLASTTNALRAVDGTGWIPTNFKAISSGAPLATLPIDPVNNATNYYAFAATSSNVTWKAVMSAFESTKYSTGTAGVPNNDGGSIGGTFEFGTVVPIGTGL